MTEAWRWVNLACYCFSMIATATIKYGFAPIAMTVHTVYEVPLMIVNYGVISYFIAFIVCNFPAIYLLDRGTEVG